MAPACFPLAGGVLATAIAERRRDSSPADLRLSGKRSELDLQLDPAATCGSSLPEDHSIESVVKNKLQHKRECRSEQFHARGRAGLFHSLIEANTNFVDFWGCPITGR
jgi:hypothetical protein